MWIARLGRGIRALVVASGGEHTTTARLWWMPTRAERIRADLLSASFEYIQGRRSFEGAITAARSVGWSDEEIAQATGLSVSMVQAVSPPQPQRAD